MPAACLRLCHFLSLLPLFNSLFFVSHRADSLNLLNKFSVRAASSDFERSELKSLVDFVDYKPWRAPKIKILKIHYKPCTESCFEKFRNETDETIYMYTIPESSSNFDASRINEVWESPWFWTKIKAERLSWLHKLFYNDVTSMSAQEHIEMDSLFAEFDMPVRWGYLRLKEMDVLNVIALWLVFWTDFNGFKPTDLGLRPDGTVRTCSVQFHNCISSSNEPTDTEHYAPPLKWSRLKSPDQVGD